MPLVPTITIDAAGRVVIPKHIRQSLRLHPGSHLRLVERERSLVLEPVEEESVLVKRDGLVLIGGKLDGKAPDVRGLREEWLDDLTARTTGRRSK